MTDDPDQLGDDEEIYESPEPLVLVDGDIVVTDISLLGEAVMERYDCAPLAWQVKDSDLFVLTYRRADGFKWQNIESIGGKPMGLKSVN